MYLEIKSSENAMDFSPPVASLLQGIPDGQTFHKDRQLRHPVAQFNISLKRLLDRILSVIDGVNLFHKKDQSLSCAELPLKIESLLLSIEIYIEACEDIIISLFRREKDHKRDACYKKFHKQVKPYRDRVAKIINAVKHRSYPIRLIEISDNMSSVIGYYIESVEDDVQGPYSVVHEGRMSAVSLPRDLKWHFVNMFFVANHLETAIKCILNTLEPQKNVEISGHAELTFKIIKELTKMNNTCFPDEIEMENPKIGIEKKMRKKNVRRVLKLTQQQKDAKTFEGIYKVNAIRVGDGHTNVSQLPYFGTKWEERWAKILDKK